MLTYLHNLPELVNEDPSKAQALVASGVFGWDTIVSSITGQSEFAQTLFHAMVCSPQAVPAMVDDAHAWFLTQPDGALRWDSLLWDSSLSNLHARTPPVRMAFQQGRWAMATAVTEAMREVRPDPTLDPSVFSVRQWLHLWQTQHGRDTTAWCRAATWLNDSGWVAGDAWGTAFNPGLQDGDHHPLALAAVAHGEVGVRHLLDLGTRPRGTMPIPMVSEDYPPQPVLYLLLKQWCLLPSLAMEARRAEMERIFTMIVVSDRAALDGQRVAFRSPAYWPMIRVPDGHGGEIKVPLVDSDRLTLDERNDLIHRTAAVPKKIRKTDAAAHIETSTLPLTLLLRAAGPEPVRQLLEQELLRASMDGGTALGPEPARARPRL